MPRLSRLPRRGVAAGSRTGRLLCACNFAASTTSLPGVLSTVRRACARRWRRGRITDAAPQPGRGAQVYCLLVTVAALGLAGCRPSIGSACTLSTDCSTQGNRVCDTAQPGGYCTVLNCIDNSCPDNAVCVMFQVSVPGCSYDDYAAPARTGLAMCMKHCNEDSNCRESDGYACADPRESPWYGAILDDNQGQRVCIAASSSSTPAPEDASICLPYFPPLPEAGVDGGDGGADSSTAAVDAGESADASIDATLDSGAEGGAGPGVSGDASDASGDGTAGEPAGDAEEP